jgi:hypothetical protein
MPDERIRPPGWLKPMKRAGVLTDGFEGLAGRLPVFRIHPIT